MDRQINVFASECGLLKAERDKIVTYQARHRPVRRSRCFPLARSQQVDPVGDSLRVVAEPYDRLVGGVAFRHVAGPRAINPSDPGGEEGARRPASCWSLELIIRLLARYSQQWPSLFSPHHDMQCFDGVHVYHVESGRPVAVLLRPGICSERRLNADRRDNVSIPSNLRWSPAAAALRRGSGSGAGAGNADVPFACPQGDTP